MLKWFPMYWNDHSRGACTCLQTHTCTCACLHTHFLTCFGEEVHLANFERHHCRSAWCQHFRHYTTNKARGTSAIWHLRTVNLIRKRQKKGCQVPLIIRRKLSIWPSLPDRPCWVFKMDGHTSLVDPIATAALPPKPVAVAIIINFSYLWMLKAAISHITAEWSTIYFASWTYVALS